MNRVFRIADQKGIHEGRQRLRIGGAGAAGQYQRIPRTALGLTHREARQVQHRQDIRVGELGLQREADDVELPGGSPALEGEERDGPLPHLALHVGPWGVGTLHQPLRPPVHHMVKHLRPHVAHPDLVGVGIAEQETGLGGVPVLLDDTQFAADVAVRLGDQREDLALQQGAQG